MTTTEAELRVPAPDGPAYLPLRWENGETPFVLWHFDFAGDRWIAAYTGDLHGTEPMPLRIESACVFGHVLRSAQCDCGYQLEEAMKSFARHGRGLLLYGVDQDARGLGIASHFAIYAMRQQENLDTQAVYARLDAPVDARSYEPVAAILRHLGVSSVRLLSNNPRREAFLRAHGFTVENEALEAPLDIHNMSTLMLEKEDLGYRWSFETHADWLEPLQRSVEGHPDRTAACAVAPGGAVAAGPLAQVREEGRWGVADRLAAALTAPTADGLVVYLTDLPRADELPVYAGMGAAVVVVPFANLPSALRKAAHDSGIRLVDWERRNAYRQERPQWRLTYRAWGLDVYRRHETVRAVAVGGASGGHLLGTLEQYCRSSTPLGAVPLQVGQDASVNWVELNAHGSGMPAEEIAARVAGWADAAHW
ncbi:hypothetical protein QQY24_06120 [Streptomyces sp. TG1A-8]|uniref:hypothetical protein n=1 Tax=Streptomyces sp. TG1A-8 TaxID=3051385 RepID=UPI00265C01D2|nr:hypothetical protein [Streptomyces sp. TG1A-8]MDO0925011.1 hypothetical protein [Streptomyces sp. TG1A-8]